MGPRERHVLLYSVHAYTALKLKEAAEAKRRNEQFEAKRIPAMDALINKVDV